MLLGKANINGQAKDLGTICRHLSLKAVLKVALTATSTVEMDEEVTFDVQAGRFSRQSNV